MNSTILTLLYEWKERVLPEVIERDINLEKYISIRPKKIIVITGFRRVGKTYLMYALIKHLLKTYTKEDVIYINFEDERIPLKTEFLSELLPAIKQAFGKLPSYLFLDEIQNIPNWSKWVRRIHDTTNIKIFISGSSSKLSSKEIPTELRGRALEIHVDPLSFSEFLKFKNLKIDFKVVEIVKEKRAELLNLVDEYIKFGGLPEIVLANKENKLEIAHSYYNTVVRKDIIERNKIKNEEVLKALLSLLITSQKYSVSKLYNILKNMNFKIGKTTLNEYISYIENSYFIWSLPIFSYKIKDQLMYPRKVYVVDNVFIRLFSRYPNIGRLFENLVANVLRSYYQELYYWASKHEEVDFVVVDKNKKFLIQACYDPENLEVRERELKALLKASKEFGCKNLFVVTYDYQAEEIFERFGIKRKIKFIPVWKFFKTKKFLK